MSKLKDLTGQRFGRLTVIERAEKSDSSGNVYWKCKCDCGKIVVTAGHCLRNGHSQSCGCLSIELSTKRKSTHGKRHSKIYGIWCGIKKRCFNSNDKGYKNYGGRGITMYPEWIDNFQAFYDYVSKLEHYGEKGYSIDRIDNNGNYEPNNLRWADRKTQSRNQRTNHLIHYKNKTTTLAEVAELSGIDYGTLWWRIKQGWEGDKLFAPVK